MSQIDIPNFEKVLSGNGTAGNMGDTGAVYTAKINGNFALIKLTTQQIDAILTDMATKMLTFITAGAVKSLNITNSGILQYSTDGVTYKDCIEWGKIRGNISSQSDLKTLLDEKASNVTVTALQSLITGMRADVNTNTDNIAANLEKINQNTTDISEINLDLGTINNALLVRPLGNGIRQFRISGGKLQYSLSDPAQPNPTWVSVSADVAVSWELITGSPTDNPALNAILIEKAEQADVDALNTNITLLTTRMSQVESKIGDYDVQTLANDLNTHTSSRNNPHRVTASQVGLGNVNNTSDADKPVSTLQQQAIDAAKAEALSSTADVQAATNSHIAARNNPHNVTKTQIGLGNVDNTSDKDKPVSDQVKQELLRYVNSVPGAGMFKMNQVQYDNLSEHYPNTLYIIDNTITAQDISWQNAWVRYDNDKVFRGEFSFSDDSIKSIVVTPYFGGATIEILYNGSTEIPSSGNVEITARVVSSNDYYNESTFKLGNIIIE